MPAIIAANSSALILFDALPSLDEFAKKPSRRASVAADSARAFAAIAKALSMEPRLLAVGGSCGRSCLPSGSRFMHVGAGALMMGSSGTPSVACEVPETCTLLIAGVCNLSPDRGTPRAAILGGDFTYVRCDFPPALGASFVLLEFEVEVLGRDEVEYLRVTTLDAWRLCSRAEGGEELRGDCCPSCWGARQ